MRRFYEWKSRSPVSTSNNTNTQKDEFQKVVDQIVADHTHVSVKTLDEEQLILVYYNNQQYGLMVNVISQGNYTGKLEAVWTTGTKKLDHIIADDLKDLADFLEDRGIIKSRRLIEWKAEVTPASTIDEFIEYPDMWEDNLVEWKSRGGSASIQTSATNPTTKHSSGIMVYVWDMYLDPQEKGTFRSADKYSKGWDGMVFETKAAAEAAGWEHLLELEDENMLSDDPDDQVLPWDFVIDTIEIPIEDVTKETLEWSGLDHLI